MRRNRAAWETAAGKYVREHDDLLREAREGTSLHPSEIELLRPLLRAAPAVVHLQSGHGLDDVALVAAGARTVIGVDYSAVTTGAAHRRAATQGLACRYVAALWSWDADEPRIRADRSYFSDCFVNDTPGAAPPGRTPRTVLAAGRNHGGGLVRAAAERVLPARPPPAGSGRPASTRSPAGCTKIERRATASPRASSW